VLDPSDVPCCNENAENRDRLKVNEIVLQFMAFSRSHNAVHYTFVYVSHTESVIVLIV